MVKKLFFVFCLSFVISSLSLLIQTNSNAATGTTCEKSTTAATLGAIIISNAGVAGSQTYGSGPATKAPFNYADGIIDSDSGSNNTDACSQMPDEYKIKFYEVYLCSKDPYNENASPDFSSCTSIFSDSSFICSRSYFALSAILRDSAISFSLSSKKSRRGFQAYFFKTKSTVKKITNDQTYVPSSGVNNGFILFPYFDYRTNDNNPSKIAAPSTKIARRNV